MNKRKENGVVYTPQWIVSLMLNELFFQRPIDSMKIIDPSCGDGSFLQEIVHLYIKIAKEEKMNTEETVTFLQKNIWGFDIDEESVEKCKNNLNHISHAYHLPDIHWNLIHMDSLHKPSVEPYFNQFDIVIGNPPYVRIQHIGEERKKQLQNSWKLCEQGLTDFYIAFFELGYELLHPKGQLFYITPNTFLKTKTGKHLREFFIQTKSLTKIIDFGDNQVFPNASTYSAITKLCKQKEDSIFTYHEGKTNPVANMLVNNFDMNELGSDNWILKSQTVIDRVKYLENRGRKLKEISRIHTGVTTLADSYYIFSNPEFIDDKYAKITLKDGRSFIIERNILKPIIKVSTLKNPTDNQNQFIIFPYKKNSQGKHQIIPEQDMISDYPFTYQYFQSIKDVLLSRDKGKVNKTAWYAFGRNQGLDTSFGRKIITSGMNKYPNFMLVKDEESTFYAGYCIKYDGDMEHLLRHLNSNEMDFYIKQTSRHYLSGYNSYAKGFIENYSIPNHKTNT